MPLEAHLAELAEKHRALERQIEQEQARPMADPVKITDWKRKKLHLKEEIERIRQRLS